LKNPEPIFTQILKGLSVDFRINVWKKIHDVLSKMLETADLGLPETYFMMLTGASPAVLLRINATVDVEVDDHMQQQL
jgi:hypothetical protein